MKSRLLTAAAAAAALAIPATAGATLAKANQFEGTVAPNDCGAVQHVTVNGPTRIEALFAGNNASGFLFAEILGPAGGVRSDTGPYNTPSGGTYGVRACFISEDGIDAGPIAYVGTVLTSAPH